MTKQSSSIIVVLTCLALLLGYNYFAQPFANIAFFNQELAQSPLPEESATQVQLSDAQKIVSSMTPQQKIAQLLSVPLRVDAQFNKEASATQSAQLAWIQQHNPGSVVLFGSNISTQSAELATRMIKSISEESVVQPLVAVDHEGGTVQRLKGAGFTALSSWSQLCKLNQVDFQIQMEQTSEQLAQVGIDVVLGPVLDVANTNSVLNTRICAGDFDLVGQRARLAANVFLKQQITPVFKHFPGIGQAKVDLHNNFDSVLVTEDEARLYRELLDVYQEKGVGVMVAHAGVENQDSAIPCSMSSACVSQLTDNFPLVLVFSDDVLMGAAFQGIDQEKQSLQAVVLNAILAGNQQIIIGPGADSEALSELLLLTEEAYANNPLVKQVIDSSVEKVVEFKLQRLSRQ